MLSLTALITAFDQRDRPLNADVFGTLRIELDLGHPHQG